LHGSLRRKVHFRPHHSFLRSLQTHPQRPNPELYLRPRRRLLPHPPRSNPQLYLGRHRSLLPPPPRPHPKLHPPPPPAFPWLHGSLRRKVHFRPHHSFLRSLQTHPQRPNPELYLRPRRRLLPHPLRSNPKLYLGRYRSFLPPPLRPNPKLHLHPTAAFPFLQ